MFISFNNTLGNLVYAVKRGLLSHNVGCVQSNTTTSSEVVLLLVN